MERGEAGGGGEEEGRAATEVITRVMVAICGIRFTSFKYFFTSINAHVPDKKTYIKYMHRVLYPAIDRLFGGCSERCNKYQFPEDDTQIVSSSTDTI